MNVRKARKSQTHQMSCFASIKKKMFVFIWLLLVNSAHLSKSQVKSERKLLTIPTVCGTGGVANKYCSNRGRCTVDPSNFGEWNSQGYCLCNAGFYGARCEFALCSIDSNVCNGSGQCVLVQQTDSMGHFTFVEKCVCNSGRFGEKCEINPCESVTCNNVGTCVAFENNNQVYGYYCVCPDGFFGRTCQFHSYNFQLENRIILNPNGKAGNLDQLTLQTLAPPGTPDQEVSLEPTTTEEPTEPPILLSSFRELCLTSIDCIESVGLYCPNDFDRCVCPFGDEWDGFSCGK